MFYYVIQELSGGTTSYGPYSSEQARDNRYDKIEGGELHKFNTFTSDANQALEEFRAEGVRSL